MKQMTGKLPENEFENPDGSSEQAAVFTWEDAPRFLDEVFRSKGHKRGFKNVKEWIEKLIEAEDLIEIIESSMSSPVCELLKRPDENATVMNAHRKPVFVEDCVRNMMEKIAFNYSEFPDDVLITSRQENEESIHRHNAFAEKVTTLGELKEELSIE